MKITEEMFRERFLKEFSYLKDRADELSTIELNSYSEEVYNSAEDFTIFLYHLIKEYDLPLEKFDDFPWTKYFKDGFMLGLEQHIRRWLGMEYDEDLFEEKEPFYYDTLKDYFFGCLEKIEKSGD